MLTLDIPDHEFSDPKLRSAYMRALSLARRFAETAEFLVMAETRRDEMPASFIERLVEEIDFATKALGKHDTKKDMKAAIELDLVQTVERATYPDIAEMRALQDFVDLATGRKPLKGWDPDLYADHRLRAREGFQRRWNMRLDSEAFEEAVMTWRDASSEAKRLEGLKPLLPWLAKNDDPVESLLRKVQRHRRTPRKRGRPTKE